MITSPALSPRSTRSSRRCAGSSIGWPRATTRRPCTTGTTPCRIASRTKAATTWWPTSKGHFRAWASSAADFERPLSELSGGQKNRAMLARAILSSPDVLLLDEPTNHLDFQAVEFLEEYLAKSRRAYLVVTHDRRFLDRVARGNRGPRERKAHGVLGRVHVLSPAEGGARPRGDARVREAAGVHRKRAGVHPPQHRGSQFAPGEGPAHAPRAGRSAREARGRRDQRGLPLRRRSDRRARVPPGEGSRRGLRGRASDRPPRLVRAPAGRTARDPRRKRHGQDDAPEDARRPAGSSRRLRDDRARRLDRLLRPGAPGPRPEEARDRRRLGRAPGRDRGVGAVVPRALRLPRRRRVLADRGALGRREGAPDARGRDETAAQPPPARRADQPPGPGFPRGAGGIPRELPGLDRVRVARPGVHRSARHAGRST